MIIKPVHKKIAIAAGGVVIVLGVAIVMAVYVCGGPEFNKKVASIIKSDDVSREDMVQVMTTVALKDLPESQRRALMEKMQAARRDAGQQGRPPRMDMQLSDKQRKQMRENMHFMMRQRMRQKMKEFYALKTDAERNAFLDKDIDEMQERMKNRPQRPPQDQNKTGQDKDNGNDRKRPSAEERQKFHKARMDSSSTVEHAQFSNYMHAVHQRMEARGITPGRH